MRKLGVIIALLVIFSFVPGLLSCAKAPTTPTVPTAPTTPTTPTTPTAPTAEKPFKPIKLKYGFQRHTGPEFLGQTTHYVLFPPAVEALSNGRIKIELYPAESLFVQTVAYESTIAGVADISGANPYLALGFSPLIEFWYLPRLPVVNDAMTNGMIAWFKMYDRFFQKDHESRGFISAGFYTLGPAAIFSVKKPIRKVEDFKGMTLRIQSKLEGDLLTKVGGLPISMTIADVYEAMQKGIVEGGSWNWEGPFSRKWTELGKPGYLIDASFFPTSFSEFIINKATYNSLPKDLQDLLISMMWRWISIQFPANVDAGKPIFQKMAKEKGIEVIIWPDEMQAKLFKEISEPFWDQWVKDIEKKLGRGAEAAEIVKVYKEEVAKYKPPKSVAVERYLGGDQAAWDKVWGKPDSTWDRDYKAYPNQTGLRQLAGNEFQAWK